MANAKFCDRCGNFFMKANPTDTYYTVSSVRVATRTIHGVSKPEYVRKTIDLCPECQGKLNEFMQAESYKNT